MLLFLVGLTLTLVVVLGQGFLPEPLVAIAELGMVFLGGVVCGKWRERAEWESFIRVQRERQQSVPADWSEVQGVDE